MKRNKQNLRNARRTKTQSGKSRYAEKRANGNMMYGPGCCGHKVDTSPERLRRLRQSNGVRLWSDSDAGT